MLTICGTFDLLFFFFFLGQLCLLLRISYKKRTASSYVIQFIMLPCIECSQSFKTLRELRRHERCHLRKLHCGECDCYFTSKEKEATHIATVHRRSIATQTEWPSSHRSDDRRQVRLPKRAHYPRPRWQPVKSSRVEATPRREVASVIINPKDPLGLEEDDDLDLSEPVDIQIG